MPDIKLYFTVSRDALMHMKTKGRKYKKRIKTICFFNIQALNVNAGEQ